MTEEKGKYETATQPQAKVEPTATHAEAPASFTVKLVHPLGFDCMFTIRGTSGAELLPKAEAAISWAVDHGYTPMPARSNGNGHTEPKSDDPDVLTDDKGRRYKVCPLHDVRMYEHVGKDGAKWFSHQLADESWCKGKAKK